MEKYVGISFIIFAFGIMLYVICSLGINAHIIVSKEKIEVNAVHINSNKTTVE